MLGLDKVRRAALCVCPALRRRPTPSSVGPQKRTRGQPAEVRRAAACACPAPVHVCAHKSRLRLPPPSLSLRRRASRRLAAAGAAGGGRESAASLHSLLRCAVLNRVRACVVALTPPLTVSTPRAHLSANVTARCAPGPRAPRSLLWAPLTHTWPPPPPLRTESAGRAAEQAAGDLGCHRRRAQQLCGSGHPPCEF